MSNSFASRLASDIAVAQRTANPPALQILERFVAAIQPFNPIALKREFDELDKLTGSQMRLALVLFPDDFLAAIQVSLSVAEQRGMLLKTIDWLAENKYFAWRFKPRDMTWAESVWSFITTFIEEQRGEPQHDLAGSRTRLDELTRAASFFGELIKGAGNNTQAAVGPILAQEATLKILMELIEHVLKAGIVEPANGQDPRILRSLAQQIAAIEKITVARTPSYPLFDVEWDGGSAMIFNAFAPERERTYPVLNFSNLDKTLPSAPTIEPGKILERRKSQIKSVLGFYGLTLDPSAKPSLAETMRQQSFIKTDKPASPLDHDGIIQLLTMAFLEAMRPGASNRAQAGWQAAIDLLEILLDQLTTHPGHDMDDNGPNYLTTLFPLTLAGDQLHDCAVYAVRVAYWLHALAARLRTKYGLDLRIWSRLVTLPVHLALIVGIDPDNIAIDPEAMPSGGLIFVNNNHLDRLDGVTLATTFANWKSTRPANDRDPKDKDQIRTKFFDDLAAGRFIPGVDMPLTAMPFIANAAKVSTALVWQRYSEYRKSSRRREIFGNAVFKGNGDYLEYYLKYLLILQSRAKFVNTVMIVQLWNKQAPETFANAMGKYRWNGPNANVTMQRYLEKIDPVTQEYDQKIDQFMAEPDDFLNQSDEFEMFRKRSQAKGGTDKLSHREYLTLINEDFDSNGKIIVGAAARRIFGARNSDSSVEDHIGANLEAIKAHARECKIFLSGNWNKPEPPPEPPFIREFRYQQPL